MIEAVKLTLSKSSSRCDSKQSLDDELANGEAMRNLKAISVGSTQAIIGRGLRAAPSNPLATSAEDISKAIYEHKGFTREAALKAFSNIKRRSR